MEWIIGILAIIVLLLITLLITLYRMAIRESSLLSNYALMILLDGKVYTAQCKGLVNLVHSIEAKTAYELGAHVNIATIQLAKGLEGTRLDVAGLLWKLKKTPIQQDQ